MRAIVAVLERKGGNAAGKALAMLDSLRHKGANAFGLASPSDIEVKSSLELLEAQSLRGSTAVGQAFVKIMPWDRPQLFMLERAAMVFDGRVYSPPEPIDWDIIIGSKGEPLRVENAEAIIKTFEGGFAFAIADDERLIVGRDPLGLYPLYYGGNGEIFAAASECKALWKIGLREAKSFPPGHIAIIDKKSQTIREVKLLKGYGKIDLGLNEAAGALAVLLERSTRERVQGLDEVALAFSGGLDSSLIAFLVKRAGLNAHLIHVSLEGQPETDQARKAADLLGIPLHVYLYKEEDVEQSLPKVLWAIESSDPTKVAIGIPIFWAAERAAEMGFKVLLAGQGADELFGGYMRYLNACLQHGEEYAQRKILDDVEHMYENNFERDCKICSFHNVELRLPFAASPLVEFALKLPLDLKIEPKKRFRKVVLRKAAGTVGVPPQIANAPKKAVQYATGVSKALRRLAKKNNMPLKEYLENIFLALQ